MPAFAILLAKMLFVLVPANPFIRSDSDKYCLIMALLAVGALICGFGSKLTHGLVSENVTLRARKTLYSKILTKELAWFDEKENSPGILSTTMASDVQTLNGVSSEGLSATLYAGCTLLTGIVIALFYSWKETLVCLACVPILAFGESMNIRF